ncbi:MAG: helix-turn-helix domain-containing protein [Ruminococcaceae bacterium]|nr:helix-turn-helix domain-containing protein [Oscillospiraceae bacterium]
MAERTPFAEKWRPMCHPCANLVMMVRHVINEVAYAPLYIHSFRLVQPHTLVEAERFNIRYTDPVQIDNTPDKLRWYRYQKGLLQRDVADFAGIDRSTYGSYEEAGRDYYPIEHMEKIAQLFDVPVEVLLDDYNLFLYNGQGKQIKAMRAARNMTQAEYARLLGVPIGNLKQWEIDRVKIFKSTWQRIMLLG